MKLTAPTFRIVFGRLVKLYYHYQNARTASWQVLCECSITALPVDLAVIAKHYHICIEQYSKCPLISLMAPETLSGDGFIAMVGGHKVIFLNDRIKTLGRRRFTLGHELGHGILGHPLDVIQTRNSQEDCLDQPLELEANVFSRDILAPACVLYEMGVRTPEEIMRICNISRRAAEIRAERLRVLRSRGKWYTHHLEQKVRQQFSEFILANKLR